MSNILEQQPLVVRQVFRWEALTAAVILFGVVVITTSLFALSAQYNDRIMPNVLINEQDVGGLTKTEAEELLSTQAPLPDNYDVIVAVDDIMISSNSAQVRISSPYPSLISQALEVGKHRFFVIQATQVLRQLFRPTHLSGKPTYNEADVLSLLTQFKNQVDIEGQEPAAKLGLSKTPSSLSIFAGKPGRSVDIDQTMKQLNAQLAEGNFPIRASVASTSTTLTEAAQELALQRAEWYVGRSIQAKTNEHDLSISDTRLVQLLSFPEGYSSEQLEDLIQEWADTIDRSPTDAVFSYNPETLVVETFVPDRDGLALDRKKTAEQLQAALTSLETDETSTPSIELVVSSTPPGHTLANTNTLGIAEQIGVGKSEYHGSILTRVHNVAITSERITDTIVKPGEEFSFNKTLGEVSSRTGFKPAYVIRAGKTELGDGGGVCQVSSTLFRALLDSGLDITRRLQHSYRVGYYELNSDPGFDATVYAGNVDLRFKNDTDHHVLIHVINDSEKRTMTIELYGTSDGRYTEVIDYQKWGAVGALSPEYILDPNLQPGQKIQIDWAVGGLKTKFTHRVYKANGELLRENNYYSNYRPWSAKYRVGQLP
ncbi:VanW family protein [Candidatus Woesebacteria bacterium]|nr:VanW family protein [Candidatus Woesebacteria bacterium]